MKISELYKRGLERVGLRKPSLIERLIRFITENKLSRGVSKYVKGVRKYYGKSKGFRDFLRRVNKAGGRFVRRPTTVGEIIGLSAALGVPMGHVKYKIDRLERKKK